MFLRIMILFLYPVTIGHVTPPTRLTPLVLVQGVFLQVWLSFLGSAPIRQPFTLLSQLRVLLFFWAHTVNMVVSLLSTHFFAVGVLIKDSVVPLGVYGVWSESDSGPGPESKVESKPRFSFGSELGSESKAESRSKPRSRDTQPSLGNQEANLAQIIIDFVKSFF